MNTSQQKGKDISRSTGIKITSEGTKADAASKNNP